MDFASLMSKKIAQSKGASKDSGDGKSAAKFISKREVEEQRKAKYLAEQKELEEKRAAKAIEKRKREEDAAEEAKIREEKRQRLAEESRRRREEQEAEEERIRRKRLGLPELPPPGANDENEILAEADDDDDDDELEDIADEELTARLRELGEPTTLFGETHTTRLRRYRTLAGLYPAVEAGPNQTSLRPVPEKDMKVPGRVPPAEDKKARR